jgi:hypothetical protein
MFIIIRTYQGLQTLAPDQGGMHTIGSLRITP